MPLQSAGIGIERDDRIRIKIVALTLGVVEVRSGIADPPIGKVEIRIVGTGDPYRRAAVGPGISTPGLVSRLPGSRNRIKFPSFLACFRFVCGDKAANTILPASHPNQHLVLD